MRPMRTQSTRENPNEEGSMFNFACCFGSAMHIISIVAYAATLTILSVWEFGEPKWTLYLYTVKTLSAAGAFNYSIQPNLLMEYNISNVPHRIDGVTFGEPVGIFSPVLVSCIALGLSIIGHVISVLISMCPSSTTARMTRVVAPLFLNATKLIIVVLVFMVCGVRDVASIMLLSGIQTATIFIYSVIHNANPIARTNVVDNGGVAYGKLGEMPPPANNKPDLKKQVSKTLQVQDETNGLLRLTLVLVIAFQYAALGVAVSGNYMQIPMIYVTVVFLFCHDLLYFLLMAVLVPSGYMCGGGCATQENMAIFFDWFVNVPIPFFLYFVLHNK